MSNDQVSTPGGLRPKDKVHVLPVGHYVDASTGSILQHNAKGEVVKDHGPMRAGTVDHDDILVAQAGTVDQDKALLAPLTPFAFPNGLVTRADWTNTAPTPVNLFLANWHVPHPPASHDGQILYIYIGIETGGITVQLALQWGKTPAGGGNHWAVATWFQAPNVVLLTTAIQVFPGQNLTGAMALKQQSGPHYSYEAQFLGIPNTLFIAYGLPRLNTVYTSFATFFVIQASDYPSAVDTLFTDIVVQTGLLPSNPVWTAHDYITNLGQHTSVVSNAYGAGLIIVWYV